MIAFIKSLPYAVAAACICSSLALAQAPAGASGSCKDGTYTTATSKRGACSGHGGVKDWFADQQATAPTAAPPPTSTAPRSTTTAAAPAGSTGSCKDGTFTSASSKRGACSGHGGVKDWYPDQQAAAPTAAPPPPTSTAPRSTTTTAAPTEQTGTMRSTTAPGGGRGQVWVNTASKVYHCPGDQWYGKTEKGAYMTESAAKAQGDRPAYNRACSP